jgi:hypothetical protein
MFAFTAWDLPGNIILFRYFNGYHGKVKISIYSTSVTSLKTIQKDKERAVFLLQDKNR